MEEYKLEGSNDGEKWEHITSFEKGDPSRFGTSFDPSIAVMEAKSFKAARPKVFKHLRVVIPIEL